MITSERVQVIIIHEHWREDKEQGLKRGLNYTEKKKTLKNAKENGSEGRKKTNKGGKRKHAEMQEQEEAKTGRKKETETGSETDVSETGKAKPRWGGGWNY